jgi:N-acetylglucosaminyl-diphospho-decaprenol L-rhamnosyltransferase
MIYLIIVNYYSTYFISRLIRSIQEYTHAPHQIIIVNNSPKDQEIGQLKNNAVILEAGANLGFGCGCNLGLDWVYEHDPKAIAWLINPDTYLSDDALKKIKIFFEEYSELSIVGTTIYTADGEIWFSRGDFNSKTGFITSSTTPLLSESYESSEWVTGCSLLINLQKFSICPKFDNSYFLYYEDFDFCRRHHLQGHSVVVTPKIHIVHQPSSITNKNIFGKLKWSTYGYLLTLEKYTHYSVLLLRATWIILSSLILFPLNTEIYFGRLLGVWLFLKKRFWRFNLLESNRHY